MSQSERTAVRPRLAPGRWAIDPAHSNVEFVARHLLSRLRGRFTEFAGWIDIGEDPSESTTEVTIQAASIGTNLDVRDERLRGPDFLDAGRFPTITFRSSGVQLDGDRAVRLDGELTVRDVSRAVALDVELLGCTDDPWGGTRAGFSARTEIDRGDFGVSWNAVLEGGGLLVGKRVLIELEIEALLSRG